MSTFTRHRTSDHDLLEPLPADLVLDIAIGLAEDGALWEACVRQDRPVRDAVRVLRRERYEAWVIGWPSEHWTTPHDHGGSVGALVVVGGHLVERAIDRRGGELHRRLGPGEGLSLAADIVHDVGTLPDSPATSIHVYSPPLATMTFYDDRSRLPAHVLDVAEPAPGSAPASPVRALLSAAGSSRA